MSHLPPPVLPSSHDEDDDKNAQKDAHITVGYDIHISADTADIMNFRVGGPDVHVVPAPAGHPMLNIAVGSLYGGKATYYFARLGGIELQVEAAPLSVGEPVFLTGETTGVVEFVVEEIRVALKPVQEAPQGVLCSIKVPTLIRRGDKLFKTVPSDEKADRNR